jgi:hypothetical protein
MNRESLPKLKKTVWDKWESLSASEPLADNGRDLVKSIVRWEQYCDGLGIGRLKKKDGLEFEYRGEILEESVVITDPVLYGDWLEIPKETALTILALGMP